MRALNVPLVNRSNDKPEIGVECYDEENGIYEIYGLIKEDLQEILEYLEDSTKDRMNELVNRIDETMKSLLSVDHGQV